MALDHFQGGPAPLLTNAECNGLEWVVLQSNPAGVPDDGVASANQIVLVPAGYPATLERVIFMRIGVNTVTRKRHFRVEVYDGDGVDNGSFGHFRIGGAEGTAGATGYAKPDEIGQTLDFGKRGTNGLSIAARGYADGGQVRILVGFRRG